MSTDMKEIKRRHAIKAAIVQLMGICDDPAHEDRAALIAEVERLRGKIRDLRLWAVQKWSDSEIRQKFPLARDEYGPYCPVCLAGSGREHQEHRAGCEWMLLFQE